MRSGFLFRALLIRISTPVKFLFSIGEKKPPMKAAIKLRAVSLLEEDML